MRRLERLVLAFFARCERPVGWVLCVGAVVTFGGVLTGLIATGELRLVTLLVAAGLALDGYSALRDAYDDAEETG